MMSLDAGRRVFLKQLGFAAGGLLATHAAAAHGEAPARPTRPLRIVFFLQNQGLHPIHCRPSDVRLDERDEANLDRVLESRLSGSEFPEHFAPLTPFADRMTVVHGLNGKHAQPFHSAGYAALSGCTSSNKQIAGAETIDCALAQALPAPFPLLGFGWGNMATMQRAPIGYCSSAWGRNKPAPLFCNPVMVHAELFGAGVTGEARQKFDGDTRALEVVRHDVLRMHKSLSEAERAPFQPLVDGFDALRRQRRELAAMADVLAAHAPAMSDKFTKPQTDLDWKEAGFDVACAALAAGLTNVVTIASGMCDSTLHGPYASLGIDFVGHGLGHSDADNPDWIKVHAYNSRLLAKLIHKLESVPEGTGTMMDNTLIVYTSCHAEKQHSTGNRWPFVLIGDLGGRLQTGRYLHFPVLSRNRPTTRSINALYTTLLHAVGAPRDTFNLDGAFKDLDRPGPIEELLA